MGMFFIAAFINRRFFCRFCEICNKTQEELSKWIFVGTLQKEILVDFYGFFWIWLETEEREVSWVLKLCELGFFLKLGK